MSIKVDANGIIINNADGSEKFRSDNKLLYRKFSQSGSMSFASGVMAQTDVGLVGAFNPSNDIALVFVKITAASGNVSNQVIGSTIQLSFSMLTHFTHSTTSVAVTAWDMLTAAVIGDSSSSVLRFEHLGYPYGDIGVTSSSVSFDWTLIVLSYR